MSGSAAWLRPSLYVADVLARCRKTLPPGDVELAVSLAGLGLNLLKQAKWSEAESVIRESLAIRETKIPDSWLRCNAMSLLGGALLGQGRYADAEPLIAQGYEGMRARADAAKYRLSEAAARWGVQLYRGVGEARAGPRRGREVQAAADRPANASARP